MRAIDNTMGRGVTHIHPDSHQAAIANGCEVHPDAQIGNFCRIFRSYIGPNANIGNGVTIGGNSEVDCTIGDDTRVQSGALLYHGVHIGSLCFIGPRCTTTNDCLPDATGRDWSHRFRETHILDGVNIGASVTILCGVTIGKGARIGIGSLVLKDVQPRWVAYGSPAHHVRPIPTIAGGKVKVNP